LVVGKEEEEVDASLEEHLNIEALSISDFFPTLEVRWDEVSEMKIKAGLSIDELITLYKPTIEALGPGRKPGDGSRPTPATNMKSPGPLPTLIKLKEEGSTASDQIIEDRKAPS
jgi:hypothetical protein